MTILTFTEGELDSLKSNTQYLQYWSSVLHLGLQGICFIITFPHLKPAAETIKLCCYFKISVIDVLIAHKKKIMQWETEYVYFQFSGKQHEIFLWYWPTTFYYMCEVLLKTPFTQTLLYVLVHVHFENQLLVMWPSVILNISTRATPDLAVI